MQEAVQGVQGVRKGRNCRSESINMEEQIRYLKEWEKQSTRQMYEAIFEEDSKQFVDYYYQWKIKDNDIIVMEDQKGYEVMMHLNPFFVQVNGSKEKIPYIVAVATRPDCRRQGKMQQVMIRVLQDLQKNQCPFTFLMPANPDYYKGQGFVFAALQRQEKTKSQAGIDKGAHIESGISLKKLDKEWIYQVSESANTILAENYQMFVWRDSSYYQRLLAEMESEKGDVVVLEKSGEMAGVLAYGIGEQIEIKELVLFQELEESKIDICNAILKTEDWKEEEMQFMFRITDLQSWTGKLKGEKEVWEIEVEDALIPENCGDWKIEWNIYGGNVKKLEKPQNIQKKITMDITEVTEKILEKMSIFIREWV